MGATAEGPGFRRLLFLGFGLILLAAMGGIVAGWLVGPPAASPSSGSPGLVGGGITARQAFAAAAELAGQWQEDAQLAGVSGHAPVAAIQQGDDIEWAFQFFSSSTQQSALFAVTGGEAHRVREALSPYSMATFSTRDWRVDSDRAQQMWWERGGSSMAERRPDLSLLMKLDLPEGGSHPVWTVVGFIEGTETAFAVTVDGTDGTVAEP